MNGDYPKFFRAAFGKGERSPFPYQQALAESSRWPELLDVPTGLGKTAAVTLAWLYKRGWRKGERLGEIDEATPRRLVWCLPMRVLVEQTEANIRDWLQNLGVLASSAGEGKVSVHVLMGGEPDLKSWVEHPEEDMVLIGTQDMLLSRALMRGYGMSRYQWPVHFALLHNDCLWAFDEVQLMGAALATSAQLEAFRRRFRCAKSSHSLWLSATLCRDWLATVDLADEVPNFRAQGLTDADQTQAAKRLNAHKSLRRANVSLTSATSNKTGLKSYVEQLCKEVLARHNQDHQTLVILNRVDRAQKLYQQIRKARPGRPDFLIHARFRPPERRAQTKALARRVSDRIIVATQAIEAGVDVSSRVMFTELAPWSSMVQRFGRCNRYGEHLPEDGAQIFWVNIETEGKTDTAPYDGDSLDEARKKLDGLDDVGPQKLPKVDEERPLTAVLRRKDLLDLFNTDPDLSGFDVNVSDFIRDTGTPALQVFWREFESSPNEPEQQLSAARDELCPVSLSQWKNAKKTGWYWDSLAREWKPLDVPPRPGMNLLLNAKDGGYDETLGFISTEQKSKQQVSDISSDDSAQHEMFGDDWRSRSRVPVLLIDHLGHVAREAKLLCKNLGETAHAAPVVRAARWHDIGKAHDVFDASMHRCGREQARGGLPDDGFLAKSGCPGAMQHKREYFRHELASMLAWLAQHDDPNAPSGDVDLIAYLILAHHGKVRTSLRAMPGESAAPDVARFARGIWEGDRLPALTFDGEQSEETELRLDLMELGEGEQGQSWTARTIALLEAHGPFRLAWLESLVRLADWRASAAEQAKGS